MSDITLTTSKGVILRFEKPSVLALRAVEKKFNAAKPQPPLILIAEKDREEPNESDPKYIEEMNNWMADSTERQYNVILLTGTSVVEVPKHMPKPTDEKWHGVLDALGIDLEQTEQGRYIQWVKYIAAPTQEDMLSILQKGLSMLGIREEEVAEAVNSFRNTEERGADTERATINNDQNGAGVSAVS